MQFHGARRYMIWRIQGSIDFHGLIHGSPLNYPDCFWYGAFQVPWNSMELGDVLFADSRFPWNSVEYAEYATVYSKETHGAQIYFKMATQDFHGISWNIPWTSMEPSCPLKWRSWNCVELLGTRYLYIYGLHIYNYIYGLHIMDTAQLHVFLCDIPWKNHNYHPHFLKSIVLHGIVLVMNSLVCSRAWNNSSIESMELSTGRMYSTEFHETEISIMICIYRN